MRTAFREIYSLIREAELTPTLILISATVLLSVQRCFGSMEFAMYTFGLGRSLSASLFMFSTTFLLMGIVPLLIIVVMFNESVRSYGICVGNWREGIPTVAALLPAIVVLLLIPASQTPEILAYYPLAPEAFSSFRAFLCLELPRGVLFYSAWEFFFRGFMLFGLRKYVGDWMAVCIQMIPQCLWHIGMPTGETLSSIASGLLFGIMAIRTGSILWPLLLHYAIGVGLDILIFLQQ